MLIVVNLICQYLSHRISKGNMTQLKNESTSPKGTLNPPGERVSMFLVVQGMFDFAICLYLKVSVLRDVYTDAKWTRCRR